jgi:hypothetical protein
MEKERGTGLEIVLIVLSPSRSPFLFHPERSEG